MTTEIFIRCPRCRHRRRASGRRLPGAASRARSPCPPGSPAGPLRRRRCRSIRIGAGAGREAAQLEALDRLAAGDDRDPAGRQARTSAEAPPSLGTVSQPAPRHRRGRQRFEPDPQGAEEDLVGGVADELGAGGDFGFVVGGRAVVVAGGEVVVGVDVDEAGVDDVFAQHEAGFHGRFGDVERSQAGFLELADRVVGALRRHRAGRRGCWPARGR